MKRLFSLIMSFCAVCLSNAANYLTFTAEEAGSKLGIYNNEGNNPDIQYSLDEGQTWAQLVEEEMITFEQKGDKVLLKGENPEGFSKDFFQYTNFIMEGEIAAEGSVMSLIDGVGESTVIPDSFCFVKLFYECRSLIQAPSLPAIELAKDCYNGMFAFCNRLSLAPTLPATKLAESCYCNMFYACTGLTQAPSLPATQLADFCYYGMFEGCNSLPQAPALPATKLATECYRRMFRNCKTLTQTPALPATELTDLCYCNMFSGCEGLTQAPTLPATELAKLCYSGMFEGCNSLLQAPALPATKLESSCYSAMFSGCSSLTQAPALPATALASGCYSSMFNGCKSLTQAPALPATELMEQCYQRMFSFCENLTEAPELPAKTLAKDCYKGMFRGCSNLSEIKVSFSQWNDDHTGVWVEKIAPIGTFICPKSLSEEYGVDRIPEGWNIKYIDESTGVNDAVASEIAVWTEGTIIYVRGGKGDVALYDVYGRLISTSAAKADEIHMFSVPVKGVYLVGTNGETVTTLVK